MEYVFCYGGMGACPKKTLNCDKAILQMLSQDCQPHGYWYSILYLRQKVQLLFGTI